MTIEDIKTQALNDLSFWKNCKPEEQLKILESIEKETNYNYNIHNKLVNTANPQVYWLYQ